MRIIWNGPYKVTRKVSDQNVIIQLTPDSPEIRVHADNLKMNYGRPPPAWSNVVGDQDVEQPSSSDSTEGDDVQSQNEQVSDDQELTGEGERPSSGSDSSETRQ